MSELVVTHLHQGFGGNVGQVCLNRPEALNALNLEIFTDLKRILTEWQNDDQIKAVMITAAPGRAFSSGGDLKFVYAERNNPSRLLHLFDEEYSLNQMIFEYPKPYVAFLDGITMGGGAGISIHGSHILATEKLVFAMPETSIGFYPDIGGSYFLSRMPQPIGLYLGLTGVRINAVDAKDVGLVDTLVAENALTKVINILCDTKNDGDFKKELAEQFATLAVTPAMSASLENDFIHRYFNGDNVAAIMDALQKGTMNGCAWCEKTLAQLESANPLSLLITFEAIQRGRHLSLAECLQMEAKLTRRFITEPDFYEGIRARIIDKDQNPQWRYKNIDAIEEAVVTSYF